jgi:hypothetical protein
MSDEIEKAKKVFREHLSCYRKDLLSSNCTKEEVDLGTMSFYYGTVFGVEMANKLNVAEIKTDAKKKKEDFKRIMKVRKK